MPTLHPQNPLRLAFMANFLGASPQWYKQLVLFFLLANPLILWQFGHTVAAWLLLGQFVFTLFMALICYPLQPGGLLALQVVLLDLASANAVQTEIVRNFPVILLLIFMVAGITFMRELLLLVFTRIFLRIHSKIGLSLLFFCASAVLSAFLDATTVIAIIITVALGFYGVYHTVASGKHFTTSHDHADDQLVLSVNHADLHQFRAFLRTLLMHSLVGSAVGGVSTTVGEPQNLMIGNAVGWQFVDFLWHMAPISLPVLMMGTISCVLLERLRWFDYGHPLQGHIREILVEYDQSLRQNHDARRLARLWIQAIAAILLVVALALHVAAVGLLGLSLIIFITALNGVTEEQKIGQAFTESLPFTALLVVFFTLVTMIHEQALLDPIFHWLLTQDTHQQPTLFYIANGIMSMISDNVFVATLYINQAREAFESALIAQAQFERLAIAINTGTNLPSIATPNGQAAFLFLLTSSVAPLVRLSYSKMIYMALPYTLTISLTALAALHWLL